MDYVDVTAAAGYIGTDPALTSVSKFIERAGTDTAKLGPFFPRYEGDYRLPAAVSRDAVVHYVQALDMRRLAHEMSAIFSGRMPHSVGIVPGGATETPTVDRIASFLWKLQTLRQFIDNVYIPDVLAVAGVYSDYFDIGRGCGNLMTYGVFDLETGETDLTKRQRFFTQGRASITDLTQKSIDPTQITEQVKYSWYKSPSGLYPGNGQTDPDYTKADAYSWVKAPRYDGQPQEVGPLARMVVSYVAGNPTVKNAVDGVLTAFGAGPDKLFSVLGRHAARALECKIVADAMADWVLQLKTGEPVYLDYRRELEDNGDGMGLWDAPRGALGHWISVKNHQIENYQCVVPSTWNMSPKDDNDVPGPLEQALIGTHVSDETNPFEIVRIIRAFDPCLACAIHLVTPKGNEIGKFRVI